MLLLLFYHYYYLGGGALDISLHVDDSIFFLKPEVIQPAEYRDELGVYFKSQIDTDMEDIVHKQVDIVFNILSMTWYYSLASYVPVFSSHFIYRIQLKMSK